MFSAMSLTYIVCILITAIAPNDGPCFYDRPYFDWLSGSRIYEAQEGLLTFRKTSMEVVASGGQFETLPFKGIAGFPSLHVGNLIVVLAISIRYCKLAAPVIFYFLAATFVASICFGMHYFIDAIGGAAIALLVTWFVGWSIKHDNSQPAPIVS